MVLRDLLPRPGKKMFSPCHLNISGLVLGLVLGRVLVLGLVLGRVLVRSGSAYPSATSIRVAFADKVKTSAVRIHHVAPLFGEDHHRAAIADL